MGWTMDSNVGTINITQSTMEKYDTKSIYRNKNGRYHISYVCMCCGKIIKRVGNYRRCKKCFEEYHACQREQRKKMLCDIGLTKERYLEIKEMFGMV